MITCDLKFVECQDNAYKVYFDELKDFVQCTFFVRPLVFKIIEIIG